MAKDPDLRKTLEDLARLLSNQNPFPEVTRVEHVGGWAWCYGPGGHLVAYMPDEVYEDLASLPAGRTKR